jgi:hypothetical protein
MKASKTKLGAAKAPVPKPKGKDPRSSSKRLRPSMARRQQALNHALEAYNMGSLFADASSSSMNYFIPPCLPLEVFRECPLRPLFSLSSFYIF